MAKRKKYELTEYEKSYIAKTIKKKTMIYICKKLNVPIEIISPYVAKILKCHELVNYSFFCNYKVGVWHEIPKHKAKREKYLEHICAGINNPDYTIILDEFDEKFKIIKLEKY
ncbi:MAG: hypothetical protein WCT77_10835 [Bacteroidota bacterium]